MCDRVCDITFGYVKLNGDHNSLLSRLRDTIISREVPLEAILEVNNNRLLELEEVKQDDANEESLTDDSGENEENESSESDEEDIACYVHHS